jgi:hypothetical protein
MKVLFLFSHITLLLIEGELFVCLFVCLFITITTHIVKQFVQTVHINCLSHFIIINA